MNRKIIDKFRISENVKITRKNNEIYNKYQK